MAKPLYHDVGYYETNPDCIENGPGIPPKLAWKPRTLLFDQCVKEATFVGVRYYLHPKLGDAYRYKYHWRGETWWLDVSFDGDQIQVWKGDGQAFFEHIDDAKNEREAAAKKAAAEAQAKADEKPQSETKSE